MVQCAGMISPDGEQCTFVENVDLFPTLAELGAGEKLARGPADAKASRAPRDGRDDLCSRFGGAFSRRAGARPAVGVGSAAIQVSLNGIQFDDTQRTAEEHAASLFHYHNWTISSVFPAQGPAAGGTRPAGRLQCGSQRERERVG